MDERTELLVPPPLPATRTDLLAQRKLKVKRSINDLVEDVFVKLWDEDENFQKLLDAIYDSQAVSGDMNDDDVLAALAILDRAKADKNESVASEKIHTIKLAMRVCLRRYRIGRHERYAQAESAKLALPPTEAPPTVA